MCPVNPTKMHNKDGLFYFSDYLVKSLKNYAIIAPFTENQKCAPIHTYIWKNVLIHIKSGKNPTKCVNNECM